MAVRRRSTRSLAKPATPCDLSQIDHTAEALGEFDLPDRHATSCLPRSCRSGTDPITGRRRGRSSPMVCRDAGLQRRYSVAGVIEPALQAAETARSSGRPTSDLTAYDLYLRALPLPLLVTRES